MWAPLVGHPQSRRPVEVVGTRTASDPVGNTAFLAITHRVIGMSERRSALVRRGFTLEYITLGWNVVGVVVLAVAAISARSVALAGFSLDSFIEIGASTVVIWELSDSSEGRQRTGLHIIGIAFLVLALYLAVQSTGVLIAHHEPRNSPLGIGWTLATAVVMFSLAAQKESTGQRLDNPVLRREGRVTFVDGVLATAVLAGLVLNAAFGWWWADPLAGYVLLVYAVREGVAALDD